MGAALPFVLSACNSCADAGLCRVAGDEMQPFAQVPALVEVQRGTTVTVSVAVDLRGIPTSEPLEFQAGDPAAKAIGKDVLAVFDGGRVVIRWSGTPFSGTQGQVQVTASADAKVATEPGDYYSTGDRAFIRKVNSSTNRVSPLTMTVAVQ